jgi:hypothetical protein
MVDGASSQPEDGMIVSHDRNGPSVSFVMPDGQRPVDVAPDETRSIFIETRSFSGSGNRPRLPARSGKAGSAVGGNFALRHPELRETMEVQKSQIHVNE